jgi:hypothetical protein
MTTKEAQERMAAFRRLIAEGNVSIPSPGLMLRYSIGAPPPEGAGGGAAVQQLRQELADARARLAQVEAENKVLVRSFTNMRKQYEDLYVEMVLLGESQATQAYAQRDAVLVKWGDWWRTGFLNANDVRQH